jgi:hypothetical protein
VELLRHGTVRAQSTSQYSQRATLPTCSIRTSASRLGMHLGPKFTHCSRVSKPGSTSTDASITLRHTDQAERIVKVKPDLDVGIGAPKAKTA